MQTAANPPGAGVRRRRHTINVMFASRLVTVFGYVMAIISLCSCAGSQTRPDDERTTGEAATPGASMGSHFYFRPASNPRGAWVVLLPGASGLTIFDDKDHYFRAATALNAEGFDALVVDYKPAYKAATNPPKMPTGGKIAWVAEQAVEYARATGKIKPEQPGAIVAWSLGAEGLWPLLADDTRMNALNLKAAAAYYPSNEDDVPLKTSTPLLILTGEADDVTEAKGIRAMVSRMASPIVTLHVYPNANHGFDVQSIPKPRTIRVVPLIGPSATFGFDDQASRSAQVELAHFLRRHLR